jgi:hypothetical protein
MARKTRDPGPRLEALLDERDHLRIKLSLASEQPDEETGALRNRILQLERDIAKHWDADGLNA